MNKEVQTPKKFRHSKVLEFLSNVEFVFSNRNSRIKDFVFIVDKTEEVCLLGVLLTYKFIEFTVNNNCFDQPQIRDTRDKRYQNILREYGFADLIKNYIRQSDKISDLKRLKIIETNDFFIAPQALIRDQIVFTRDSLSKKYFPIFKNYYKDDKVVRMIFSVFSEILLNFWRHAQEDNHSIIMARGNKSRLEIACVDNGDGIVSTLKNNIKKGLSSPVDVLKEAIKKNVTSKKLTNHMGYGLYMFERIAELSDSSLEIYSEGAYLKRKGNLFESNNCGFWKGTIVYMSLNLHQPITIEDIEPKELKNEFKIDWL